MLKERHRLFVSVLAVIDGTVAAAAQLQALHYGRWLAGPEASASEDAFGPVVALTFALSLPAVMVSLAAAGLYRARRDRSFRSEAWDLVKATFFAWSMIIVGLELLDRSYLQRTTAAYQLAIYPLCLLACLTAHRYAFRTALRFLRERGWNLRHVAVIGTGRLGQVAAQTFARNGWTGIHCAYFISHHPTTQRKSCAGRPIEGGLEDLEATLEAKPVDGVVIALPQSRSHWLPNLLMRLERFAVEVRIIPDVSPRYMPLNVSVGDLEGLPVLSLRQSPLNGSGGMMKRAVDLVIASAALVVFAIPMGLIACLIRLESRGPVVFRQDRVSVGSRVFRIYKFRTMRWEPGELDGAGVSVNGAVKAAAPSSPRGQEAWTRRDDPRITMVGRWLRRFSLDELPQLINVICGDMSLVGPRPERVELLQHFRDDRRGYMLRQNIKAGMTGWAQVNGLRGDTSLRKRLQYDLYYIRNWSILFDLRILALTVVRGFRNPNAH